MRDSGADGGLAVGPHAGPAGAQPGGLEPSGSGSSVRPGRRHDLDALRAFAMLLGLGLHAGLSYMEGPWLVSDSSSWGGMDVAIAAIHGFRMPLFFMLSGFFTVMLLERAGIVGMFLHRARRVGLPLLLGLVSIVPMMWAAMLGGWTLHGIVPPLQRETLEGIWEAAAAGDLAEVRGQVAADGALVNATDERFGVPPLSWAVMADEPEVVAWLLEAGADPHARHGDRSTALHSAAFFGSAASARLLLEAGANVGLVNEHGETPAGALEHAEGTTRFLAGVLGIDIDFEAVRAGREQIRLLFEAAGAEREAAPADGSPAPEQVEELVAAAARGDAGLVRALVERDPALLAARDPRAGLTALSWAAAGDHAEVVALLLELGADSGARQRDRGTALHTAAFFGAEASAAELLAAGADLTAQNANGETPAAALVHDEGTTRFIGQLLGVPVDFEQVSSGRAAIGAMFAEVGATDGGGGPSGDRDGGGDLGASAGSGAKVVAFLTEFPLFHHLWFLWHLCLLVTAVGAVAAVVRAAGVPAVPVWLVGTPLCLLVLVPMTGWTQSWQDGFGADTSPAVLPPLTLLVHYGVFFGFGALLWPASRAGGGAADRLGRWWGVYLLVASASFAVGYPLVKEAGVMVQWGIGARTRAVLGPLATSLFSWTAIFGLVGLARVLLSSENPRVRFVADSSYWLYLVHLPLVVGAQFLLAYVDWPIWLELGGMLVAITAVLLVSYRWGVRYTVIGRLLNGPRRRPGSEVGRGERVGLP